MKNIQLTCAHALVKFLTKQKILIDGKNNHYSLELLEFLDMETLHA